VGSGILFHWYRVHIWVCGSGDRVCCGDESRSVNQPQTAFTSPTATALEAMLLVFQYFQSFPA
jgi:hypothetical protein